MSLLLIRSLHVYKPFPVELSNLKFNDSAVCELLNKHVKIIKEGKTLSIHDKEYELDFFNKTLVQFDKSGSATLNDAETYLSKYNFYNGITTFGHICVSFCCCTAVVINVPNAFTISVAIIFMVFLIQRRVKVMYDKAVAIQDIHIAVIAAKEGIKSKDAKERVLAYHE